MPVFLLPEQPVFPDPELSEPDGLLAVGGDLSPERLLAAYARGVFPWYGENSPILWWSPDPRPIIEPGRLHVSRSLRRTVNSGHYQVTLDKAFGQVIRCCAASPRPGGEGTWLVPEMIEAYERLHGLGVAHSVEAWDGQGLAGGVYGVALGRAFFAESMFFLRPNASKVALVGLVEFLAGRGFELVDCQQTTPHVLRFGAREIPRKEFIQRLNQALEQPGLVGKWGEEVRREG